MALSTNQSVQLPPLPEIGRPEAWYAHHVHQADRIADRHAHEALKVGQYITLGLDPHLEWEEKLKYFNHALKRHCCPPPLPDDAIWMFYRSLADLVRTHAGIEVLRPTSLQDDNFATRISMGQNREEIENEAEVFFERIFPADGCPDHLHEADYEQLKLLRNQWI